jgi:hypothetical protein
MENSQIRDIDPTTKRLVERCLSGEWCEQYRKPKVVRDDRRASDSGSPGSPGGESVAASAPVASTSKSTQLERQSSGKGKTLKLSKSVENLKGKSKPPRPPRSALSSIRRPSTDSTGSLPGIASAKTPVSKQKGPSRSADYQGSFAAQQTERHHQNRTADNLHPHHAPPRSDSLDTGIDGLVSQSQTTPNGLPSSISEVSLIRPGTTHRRSAPPTPAKRRKPPAVPVEKTNSGATITAIASSNPVPTVKITKTSTSGLQHMLA